MLKRIILIALYTGTGQLLSIFALKYISRNSTADQLQQIAALDSLTFFIINVIAMGLQPAAMRNIALTNDWKPVYQATQSARITLGILMMALSLLALHHPLYLLFLITPLLAWSGDYALYARGYSVKGAAIAFLRLLVPYTALFIAAWWQSKHLAWVYITALVIVYLGSNLYISRLLKTPWLFAPSLQQLRLYVSSLPLGFVTLSLYTIGLGVILIAPYFYDGAIVAVAFVGLKFYMVYKGVLRIILQAFVKEVGQHEFSLRIDQLSMLIGITYAAFMIIYPDSFIRLFFGEKYLEDRVYFIVLSVGGLIYAMFNSLTSRSLLEKKDGPYAWFASLAALLTIALTVVLSFFWQHAAAIATSILAGEIAFATGLVLLMKGKSIVWPRFTFLLKNLPVLLLPVVIVLLLNDSFLSFIISLILFGIIMALLHFKKFIPPPDA